MIERTVQLQAMIEQNRQHTCASSDRLCGILTRRHFDTSGIRMYTVHPSSEHNTYTLRHGRRTPRTESTIAITYCNRADSVMLQQHAASIRHTAAVLQSNPSRRPQQDTSWAENTSQAAQRKPPSVNRWRVEQRQQSVAQLSRCATTAGKA